MPFNPQDILGIWTLLPPSVYHEPGVDEITAEFLKNGALRYVISLPDKKQVINLTYKIENDELITDQPSRPEPDTAHITRLDSQSLVLSSHGVVSTFVRRANV